MWSVAVVVRLSPMLWAAMSMVLHVSQAARERCGTLGLECCGEDSCKAPFMICEQGYCARCGDYGLPACQREGTPECNDCCTNADGICIRKPDSEPSKKSPKRTPSSDSKGPFGNGSRTSTTFTKVITFSSNKKNQAQKPGDAPTPPKSSDKDSKAPDGNDGDPKDAPVPDAFGLGPPAPAPVDSFQNATWKPPVLPKAPKDADCGFWNIACCEMDVNDPAAGVCEQEGTSCWFGTCLQCGYVGMPACIDDDGELECYEEFEVNVNEWCESNVTSVPAPAPGPVEGLIAPAEAPAEVPSFVKQDDNNASMPTEAPKPPQPRARRPNPPAPSVPPAVPGTKPTPSPPGPSDVVEKVVKKERGGKKDLYKDLPPSPPGPSDVVEKFVTKERGGKKDLYKDLPPLEILPTS